MSCISRKCGIPTIRIDGKILKNIKPANAYG
jgi:hypothetical protein